jgi:hypothetical protein
MKKLKEITLIEWLVIICIPLIVGTTILGYSNAPGFTRTPDGDTVLTIEIDGHDYLKLDKQLTHSAGCRACTQKERP